MQSLKKHPLVIASHNSGKVREIRELMAPFQITVTSAGDLGLPEPEENGEDFIANARIKSESAARLSGMPALADDSGMAVEALDGAPGIYSARWAGPEKDFQQAMLRVEQSLQDKGVEPRGARASFICVLALTLPDGETHIFEGEVKGTLTFPPQGTQGFGYDPIFIPEGENRTFGQMSGAEKHCISHRAIAFAKFVEFVKQSS